MWQVYVFGFLAGLIGANGVPHFIKGITGEKHQTPFGNPSSAVTNVVWGWVNFVVAAILLYYSHYHYHRLRAFVMVAIGALLAAVVLANAWSRQTAKRK